MKITKGANNEDRSMDKPNDSGDAASHSRFWWIPKVIPSLFMLIFAFIPMDMDTVIFHFVLVIVFIVSLVKIVKALRQKYTDRSVRNRKLLQPVIAVSVVVIDIALMVISSSMAESFAIKTARSIDGICKENKECPSNPEGFICSGGDCRTEAGLTARYSIIYKLSNDKHTFLVSVRFDIDHYLHLKGGVADPLGGTREYDGIWEEKIKL